MKKFAYLLGAGLCCMYCTTPQQAETAMSEHATGDWPIYRGGKESNQYSPLNQITPENVNQLQVAWTYQTGDATDRSAIQCNPIMVDGVLYATSPQLKLFALDAATGKEHWVFDPAQEWKGTGVN